ncbi:hypothetical protein [Streptomyces violaceusniger]|uniref:Uncharacterized protein n=1 Tax=Streptomyces violaceusniger (strain Tu 4113) TaxID=653045 RepID=G2PHN2_STRV4|nr:hypothetical protein [Streptomyces violaceusniger]AEM88833.1 hypothetical protein Strvi_0057 [Streptomyces violaceusniger Tu 4113]
MDEQSTGAKPSRPYGIHWFSPRGPRERWRPTSLEVRDVAVAAVFLFAGIALAVLR